MPEANSGLSQIRAPTLALGLNLRDGVDAVGSGYAIDCLDVDFTEKGGVKSRPGYKRLGASTSGLSAGWPNRVEAFYSSTGLPRRLIVASGNVLYACDTAGASQATWNAHVAAQHWDSARIGSAAQDYVYMSNGLEPVIRYNGASFEQPTVTVDGVAGKLGPKCVAMTVMPTDQIALYCGYGGTADGPGGAPSSPAHVFAAQPADPLNFKALDFIALRPGDGDRVVGAIAWRELAFVFKQRAFWVFSGQNTDAAGVRRFYRRAVDSGVGLVAPHACCAGRDGVYFVGAEGVYRTTGGEPELLSDVIAPLFSGAPSPFFTGATINRKALDSVRIAYFDETLYVFVPTGTATRPNRTLVYDVTTKSWTIWSRAIGHAVPFEDGVNGTRLVNATFDATTWRLQRLEEAERWDDDGDFFGFWRGGYLDFGEQVVKTMVEQKVWGYGLLTVRVGADYGQSSIGFVQLDLRSGNLDRWADGTDQQDLWSQGEGDDLWGRASPVSVALARWAVRGTTFSVALEGLASQTQAPEGWSVTTLSHHVLSPDWATTERHST